MLRDADCGLRIADFAVSGPTAIADLRLSEDGREVRNDVRVLDGLSALTADYYGLLRTIVSTLLSAVLT
jgi:hypothetical protein